jgi:hypothetical protein
MKSKRNALLAAAMFATLALPAWAQEFEPRTYSVAPPGLNFVALAYGFATGAVFMDPALPVEDVDADIHLVVARYVRTLELLGRPVKLKLALPWSSGHWDGFLEGEFRARDTACIGDARIGIEMLFAGGEAGSIGATTAKGRSTVWGARLQLITPTGQYDNKRVINLGANRWGLIPEIGFGHPVGEWSLEGAVGAWLFGDNDDFFGGLRLEQDPLFVAKFNAVRNIRPGFWWALSAGYGYGGRTTIDGVPRATIQRNWRLSVMVAYPLTPSQGLSVAIATGGISGAGTDADAITVAYQVA